MPPRFLLSLLAAVATATSLPAAGDPDVRFSKTLATSDVTAAGLPRLSSDQVAVLDALVRRDVAQSRLVAKTPRAVQFSERLTPDERRNAGIDVLAQPEVAALDQQVERLIAPPPSAGLQTSAAAPSLPGVKIRRGPEIHGMVGLTVGAGSHGYSEYGGGMVVSIEDPASGLGVALGYSEMHSKGGYPYRYWRDGTWGGPGEYWRYSRPGYPGLGGW